MKCLCVGSLLFLFPVAAMAQQARGPARHLVPGSAVQQVWVSPAFGPATPGWQVSRFDRVQDAVDAVPTGGFVSVLAGTYSENVVVERRLTLHGAGRDVTVIHGGFDEDALRVEADGVTVEGLTLRCNNPAFLGPSGLLLRSVGNTIRANAFEGCGYGLRIEPLGPTLTGNLVEGNRTGSNHRGLYVYGDWNTLRGNELLGDGIGIQIAPSVTGTLVENNSGSSSSWAIQLSGLSSGNVVSGNLLGSGIYLEGATASTVTDNTVSGALAVGIELAHSDGNTVSDNVLSGMTYAGIQLDDSDRNLVSGNAIDASGPYGIWVLNSTAETLSGNSMTRGGIAIEGDLRAEWDSHAIDGNEVLGAPIEYLRDVVGPYTVPSGAAQVILVGCSDVSVEDRAFGEVDPAVQVGFCTSVSVQRCSGPSGPRFAVSVTDSTGVVIAENDFGSGIQLHASGSVVRDNVLRGDPLSPYAYWGIATFGPPAADNIFSGNEITGFLNGLSVSLQSNVTIEDNLVRRCGGRALSAFQSDGLVADNVLTGNQGGIDVGASLSSPPGITFRGNLVADNGPFGIEAGRHDVVTGNVLVGNDVGLVLNGEATVVGNHVAGNTLGIEAGSTSGSTLHHNTLANATNAHDAGVNDWDDGSTGGNWWHDDAGEDLDLDGIGDEPHAIAPSGTDTLPLVQQPGDLLLWADSHTLSTSTGGTIDFHLHGGSAQDHRYYLLLASGTGRAPGIALPGGAVLPLVWDAITDDVLANVNTPTYQNFVSFLDPDGEGSARLQVGPLPPALAGTTLYFAYMLVAPYDHVSVAIDVDLSD